jgi:hypothetical protein
MKAALVICYRVVVAPDAFADLVIWRVPETVRGSEHGFKYRLAYVVAGQCVLRYDNEWGKGDHRHWGTSESPYVFSSPNRPMADFNADIARWNHEHGRT